MSAFFALVVFRVLDFPRQGRFSSAPFGSLGFAIRTQARQDIRPNRVSDRTDRQIRLGLLSTPPCGDAVTSGFQPVERLVERVPTSFSGALSGARPAASRRRPGKTPNACRQPGDEDTRAARG